MKPHGFRGQWRDDDDARAVYAESASIHRLTPRAVAVPVDADDLQTLLRWAQATSTPLTPRGSGSGMAGGCLTDGVVVDMSAMRGTPSVDRTRQLARCLPGATRSAVEHAAESFGLRFPVDPSSGAFCTIGGMVATNAAGARSLKFGPTRTWVSGLECVFADGTRAWIRRGSSLDESNPTLRRVAAGLHVVREDASRLATPAVRKNSSGYGLRAFARSGDLVDLLVGSEGTLAFFSEIELALCEVPVATASALVSWPTLEGAVYGAALAREAGAAACELLDRTFLEIAQKHARLPIEAGDEAVLLVELEDEVRGWRVDSAPDERPLRERAQALERAFLSAGATQAMLGLEPEASDALWSLRHAASPILARLDPSIASMQVIEDGVVPPERLADYVTGVREALRRVELRGVIFGHAADANVHVNALVDMRKEGWRDRVAQLFAHVTELTARLGGSPAGEHGDGRLRTPVLNRFWSDDALTLFSRIKALFDPQGILNPGVKVARPGVESWNQIKYDPALPEPSARVRRVLERVSHERAYDRCRLEMLDQTV